jgi:hypothetical protein
VRRISLFVLAGTVAIATSSALAGAPEQAPFARKVSITSAPDGPFTVTGQASCASGHTATTFNFTTESLPDQVKLVVGKTFRCDDGTGTFDMVLSVQVRLIGQGPPFPTTFRWMITEGTGQYESLLGSGTGVGVLEDGEFVDRYAGRVRIGR